MIWRRVFNKVEGVSGSSDFNLSLGINGQSLNWFKTSPRVGGGGGREGWQRTSQHLTTVFWEGGASGLDIGSRQMLKEC